MIIIVLRDNKYFLDRLTKLQPNIFKDVKILEEYRGVNEKLKCYCKRCNTYFTISPTNLYKGATHKNCKLRLSNEEFKTKLYKEFKDFDKYLILVSDYKGRHKDIKVKCKKCNRIFTTTPGRLYENKKCLFCYGTPKKTTQSYYMECLNKGLDLPIEDYINDTSKIKHKCSKCGYIYKQIPSNHLQGNGCPRCKDSKGESLIKNYLDEHSIEYIPQKTFGDLKDKTYLSYDFYLPKYRLLIEYQGVQHFKSVKYFGGKKQFEKQQYHDKLKREYAKNNDYKLLEIPYKVNTKNKIKEILDDYLQM